nr:SPOR domain-containing protein [Marinobacter adhaerens]
MKQRIIGALVLISLAVIFVPMVFDEPHSERTSTSINLPEEPPFPEVDAPESAAAVSPENQQDKAESSGSDVPDFRIREEDSPQPEASPEPQENNVVGDAKPAATESTEPTSAVTTPAKPEPVAAEEPAPEKTAPVAEPEPESTEFTRSLKGAWVVQLGSFGDGDNARRLRDKVREKGYNSHLQEVVRGGKTLTRVFSGPFAEKSKAEAAKKTLDETFSLNSLVASGDK